MLGFEIVTGSIILCITIVTGLSLIQYFSTKKHNKHQEEINKFSAKQLYLLYLCNFSCAIQCLLCHISNTYFPEWYCEYFMAICVIAYSISKTVLYFFFLQRARVTQIQKATIPHHKLLLNKIFPIILYLYLVAFIVLCSIFFRGQRTNESLSEITTCVFGDYITWLFIIGSVLDILISMLLLSLFVYPIYIIMNDATLMLKSGTMTSNFNFKYEFIATMKINILCTAISTLSTIVVMALFSLDNHIFLPYFWLFGTIDMSINSLAIFFIMKPNRSYCNSMFFCDKCKITCTDICLNQILKRKLRQSQIIRARIKPTMVPNNSNENTNTNTNKNTNKNTNINRNADKNTNKNHTTIAVSSQ